MKDDKKTAGKKVLAYRRTCKKDSDGTGLSHYIFMSNKRRKTNR